MNTSRSPGASVRAAPPKGGYWLAAGACFATALVATPLGAYLDLANIVMLFLLTVLLVAVYCGRGPAILAAFLSVALFDFFFVPPRFSFEVSDVQYLVTFAVMLAVALITGQLAAGLRRQAEAAALGERQTQALYEMARELAGTLGIEQVHAIVRRFLNQQFQLEAVLLLPDKKGDLKPAAPLESPVQIEQRFALIAFEQGAPVEDYSISGYGYGAGYFPLMATMRIRGVLVVVPGSKNAGAVGEHKALLATIASLAAVAVERLHYVEVAQAAQVEIVSERLRSSILSALSHDLRTPLTALVGLADSLALSKPPLPGEASETAEVIREQALRLSSLVENLLDMARLHAGRVTLRKEWQPLEEVIGASTRLLGRALANHRVRVELARDMPLVEFDAVLLERVFCNLLENAAKHSPAESTIEITGRVVEGNAEVSVCDHGPGFPPGKEDALFEMFARGVPESPAPGVGLGLAICRAIIEAHGGSITAENLPQGDACVRFILPGGTPPAIAEDAEKHG